MKNYAITLNELANTLSHSKRVSKFDSLSTKESEELAYTLLDIYESSKELVKLIKRLKNTDIQEDLINDILNDVGDELRHLIYHINDSKFYSYINVEKE